MLMQGISMGFFFSNKNKSILKKVIGLDSDNYPECLYKVRMTRVPQSVSNSLTVLLPRTPVSMVLMH